MGSVSPAGLDLTDMVEEDLRSMSITEPLCTNLLTEILQLVSERCVIPHLLRLCSGVEHNINLPPPPPSADDGWDG